MFYCLMDLLEYAFGYLPVVLQWHGRLSCLNLNSIIKRQKNKGIRDFKFFGHMYRCQVVLTQKEKEGLAIKLAEDGKTTRDIAQDDHISLKDICAISRIDNMFWCL